MSRKWGLSPEQCYRDLTLQQTFHKRVMKEPYRTLPDAEPSEIAALYLHDLPIPAGMDALNKEMIELFGSSRTDIEQNFFDGVLRRVAGLNDLVSKHLTDNKKLYTTCGLTGLKDEALALVNRLATFDLYVTEDVCSDDDLCWETGSIAETIVMPMTETRQATSSGLVCEENQQAGVTPKLRYFNVKSKSRGLKRKCNSVSQDRGDEASFLSASTQSTGLKTCQIKEQSEEVKTTFANQRYKCREVKAGEHPEVEVLAFVPADVLKTMRNDGNGLFKTTSYTDFDQKCHDLSKKRKDLYKCMTRWERIKEHQSWHKILNDERLEHRGEVVITTHKLVATSIRAKAYIVAEKDTLPGLKRRHNGLGFKTKYYVTKPDPREVFYAIEDATTKLSGCKFTRILTKPGEEDTKRVYIANTSICTVRGLRRIAQMVHHWRRVYRLKKPGDLQKLLEGNLERNSTEN